MQAPSLFDCFAFDGFPPFERSPVVHAAFRCPCKHMKLDLWIYSHVGAQFEIAGCYLV
jgi:hypothetical protein